MASRIQGITVEIGGDTTKLSKRKAAAGGAHCRIRWAFICSGFLILILELCLGRIAVALFQLEIVWLAGEEWRIEQYVRDSYDLTPKGIIRNCIEINCAVWLVFFVGSQLPQQRKTGNRNCAFPMIDNI